LSTPWTYLTLRYGSEIPSPKEADLRLAIDQLYSENEPGMTERDYEEHGAAWQRLGYDEGPMYVLRMTRTGRTTLEHWLDQDYETEGNDPVEVESLSYEVAWSLWSAFASRNVEIVRTRLRELALVAR
jgi:hypothetical protein